MNDGPKNYSNWFQNVNYGGLGGQLGITHSGSITVGSPYFQGAFPGGLAGIYAQSIGGNGGFYDSHNDCCAGSGGSGNYVEVATTADSKISLENIAPTVSAGIRPISQDGQPAYLSSVGNDQLGGGGPGWTGRSSLIMAARSQSDHTELVISPAVEVGGRYDVNARTVLRGYVTVGGSFRPTNTRTVDASFIGALGSDGTFQTAIKSPNALAALELGLQLYQKFGWEIRLGFDTRVGNAYASQGGNLRIAYRF